MFTGYSNSKPILLPLALDTSRKETKAIEFAFWMAHKLRRPIHAVHIGSSVQFIPDTVGMDIPMLDVTKELEDAEEELKATLAPFCRTAEYEAIDVTTKAYIGDAARWICGESSNALLTVLSSQPPKFGMFRRFTMVQKILKNCQGPVAIVPHDSHFSEPSSNLKLMLADDLEAHSIQAVNFAAWLATRMDDVNLNHVHITGVTLDLLKTGLDLALSGAYSQNETKPDLSVLHEQLLIDLQNKLKNRFFDWTALMKAAHTKHNCVLMQGHASEEIQKVRKSLNSDLEVFGQHRSHHSDGFGRVLFETMLSAKCPIIIVPST